MIEIKPLASGSKGNCYYITDGKTELLIECGIPWKNIQVDLDFQTQHIQGCLVTHCHKDHCKAIKDVLRAGIDCYMSEGTRQEIGVKHHRIWVVKSKTQFRIGTWTILPFDTEHDCNEPYGFLLANQDGDKLLYGTDTYYIRYAFEGLTHIMIEANYAEDILRLNVIEGRVPNDLKNRLLRSHMSLETCKDFLRATDLSRVREIWLIHMSEGNSDALRFKKEIQALTGKPTYLA